MTTPTKTPKTEENSPKTLFGLPKEVQFCKKCVMSNQRPSSTVEFKNLDKKDYEFYATEGSHDFLTNRGVGSLCLYKASEKVEPNITTFITKHDIDLIINIPRGVLHGQAVSDGYQIRRLAIDHHIPLITNLQLAELLLMALSEVDMTQPKVKSWQDYMETQQNEALSIEKKITKWQTKSEIKS